METRSALVDRGLYSEGYNLSVSGFRGGSVNKYAFPIGSGVHGTFAGSFDPHPPPYTVPYALQPPTNLTMPTRHAHPPLLPLPMSKSLSLPALSSLPQSRRVIAPPSSCLAVGDQKKQRSYPASAKKEPRRGATRPQKVPQAQAAIPIGRVPETPAIFPTREEHKPKGIDGCDSRIDNVYALSPPPSSLPMPSFCLRARTPPVPSPPSCNVEGFEAGGGGADVGASDDLRRLLRF